MEITIEMIKELREKTGCGIMDCRAALRTSNGDMDGAIEELREKGLKKQKNEPTVKLPKVVWKSTFTVKVAWSCWWK